MRHQGTGDDSVSRHQSTNQRHQGTNSLWTPVRSGPEARPQARVTRVRIAGASSPSCTGVREGTLGTSSGFVLY